LHFETMIIFFLLLCVVVYTLYLIISDPLFFGKFKALRDLAILGYHMKLFEAKTKGKKWSYADYFEGQVDKSPQLVQIMTVEDGKIITLEGMDRQGNQLARWAQSLGLKQHDAIALMLTNRPELPIFWIGMSKIGVGTALINSQLTGKPFIHSATVAVKDTSRKVLVIDSELKSTLLEEVNTLRASGIDVYFWDDLDKITSSLPSTRLDRSFRSDIAERDPLIYIYTSGTTGLPKACKLSSTKFTMSGIAVAAWCELRPGDRYYNCLPLHHTAGGMMALGGCIRGGATLVLRYLYTFNVIYIYISGSQTNR
jgi:fatty-acyl-CoA synthase